MHLNFIVYSKTRNGIADIKTFKIPLTAELCDNKDFFTIGFNLDEVKEYMEEINKKSKNYEELTVRLDADNDSGYQLLSFQGGLSIDNNNNKQH